MVLVLFGCLPFERIGAVDIAGITVRASHIAGLGLLAAASAAVIQRTTRMQQWVAGGMLRRVERWGLAFLTSGLVSVLLSANIGRTLRVWMYIAFMMSVTFVIARFEWSEARIAAVVRVIWWVALAVALFGLAQFAGDMIGLPQSVTGLRDIYTKEVFGFPRIQSTALEPLYFANFLLLPLGVFGSLLLARQFSIISQPRLWGIVALVGLNIVLTLSRGGYLAVIAVVATLLILHRTTPTVAKTIRMAVPIVGAIILISIGALVVFETSSFAPTLVSNFVDQATNATEGAGVTERTATIRQAVTLFAERPLFGVGPGGFGPAVAVTDQPPVNGFVIVNNETLELLVEHGILGFVLLLGMVVTLIRVAVRAPRTRRMETAVRLGLIAVVIGIAVQYQTFSTLYIMHVWAVIGMMYGVSHAQGFTKEPQ